MNASFPSSLRAVAVFAVAGAAFAEAGDRYPDYAELSLHEKKGVDYRIVRSLSGSPMSVFAIHGGAIEGGTSEIAKELAGRSMNLYSFEGMKSSKNIDLHITSDRFDEPEALMLAKRSKLCISIHGFQEDAASVACIGGANQAYATRVAEELSRSGIAMEISYPCKRFPGVHPKNIVNRCEKGGVQIELSTFLRNELLRNPGKRHRFIRKIRNAFSLR